MDDAERIIGLYERHAPAYDAERSRNLMERAWLDRFCTLLPPGGAVLDVGCGQGEPIARHLIETGYALTGVDSSTAMIALCKARFPQRSWHVADMRALALRQHFNGVLAWDSFFHLTPDDQRRMFPIFRAHAAPKAALMFTSGPRAGDALGRIKESRSITQASTRRNIAGCSPHMISTSFLMCLKIPPAGGTQSGSRNCASPSPASVGLFRDPNRASSRSHACHGASCLSRALARPSRGPSH
jgi:SAM-dependent methyltransferase